MSNRPTSPLNSYLHIYRVSRRDTSQATEGFVSVASLGRNRQQAEQVAINLVHQGGWRIVSTDTATAAPWLSEDTDLPYLQELERYGAALLEIAA